jgi:hypothetical protein
MAQTAQSDRWGRKGPQGWMVRMVLSDRRDPRGIPDHREYKEYKVTRGRKDPRDPQG